MDGANILSSQHSNDVLKFLVLDTGAFIKGVAATLIHKAEAFWTVPAVLDEVRDRKARHLLETLPFELHIKDPSEKSMSFATSTSHRTGDFSALSITDLKLIALTYELELQIHGTKYINEAVSNPTRQKLKLKKNLVSGELNDFREKIETSRCQCNVASISSTTTSYVGNELTQKNVSNIDNLNLLDSEKSQKDAANLLSEGQLINANHEKSVSDVDQHPSILSKDLDSKTPTDRNLQSWSTVVLTNRDQPFQKKKEEHHSCLHINENHIISEKENSTNHIEDLDVQSVEEDFDNMDINDFIDSAAENDNTDDESDWISIHNISDYKRRGILLPTRNDRFESNNEFPSTTDDTKCKAGCITTDFAIQNILFQIGLPILSIDGLRIKRISHHVLRCSACFLVTTNMDRLFCERCGNAALNKISCSIDSNTKELKLHFSKKWRPNTRGTKYSIPKRENRPRFDGDLLLREDQLLMGIWAQKSRRTRIQKCIFSDNLEEYIGITTSKSREKIVVGYGRKNPNCRRGRKR